MVATSPDTGSSPAVFDVAIAGASYSGLALAIALSEALDGSCHIAIIDRMPADRGPDADDGRAFALAAASIRLLRAISVWDAIAGEAQPVEGIDITDSSLDAGVRPVLLSYDNLTSDGEVATHIVPSHALLNSLFDKARTCPNVVFISAAQAAGLATTEFGARVLLADGREIDASLIVAADGRKSVLREAAGIDVIGWSYPQTGIVTRVRHDRPHQARAVQHFLPAGPFAILPLTGNRACITWTEDANEAKRILALDNADFLAEIDKRFGGKLGAIELDGPRAYWPLEMHLARSYVAPHFAVIGDAAHGVHPLAGQGLNLGFRDVAALTEAVADGVRLGFTAGDAQTLQRYERWRRFDSAMSAATFDAINRLFANDAALLRTAREAGLGLVDRMPALKRFFVSEAAGLTGDVPKLLRGKAA